MCVKPSCIYDDVDDDDEGEMRRFLYERGIRCFIPTLPKYFSSLKKRPPRNNEHALKSHFSVKSCMAIIYS